MGGGGVVFPVSLPVIPPLLAWLLGWSGEMLLLFSQSGNVEVSQASLFRGHIASDRPPY